MKKINIHSVLYFLLASICLLPLNLQAKKNTYYLADYGIIPNTKANYSQQLYTVLQKIKKANKKGDQTILVFQKGRYDFHMQGIQERPYYVSNHDQDQPKSVAIPIENWENLTIDGCGADFIFHGRLIPLAVINSKNCSFKNFSVDFENPQIAQIEVLENKKEGITFKVAPWVNYQISAQKGFQTRGEGWINHQTWGIPFEKDTKHILYNKGDIFFNTKGIKEISNRVLFAPNWKDKDLKPGTIVAMRSWQRPTPGIFLSHNKNTTIKNVKIHYADGMGLLAQLCDNITLDEFGVCLKGNDDPRYFTTQADATHFSQCKGKIISKNGLYENMMDDAINIHGIYLKVKSIKDKHTIIASYEHGQAYGFDWGFKGDKVQFIHSKTMEYVDDYYTISSIKPVKGEITGCKEFTITFKQELNKEITMKNSMGIENLTWTPSVYFSNNIIRNNRARGALFSSPKKTICEKNVFDHTSGAAILLCGDCNGWYESGKCQNLIIRNNTFINGLTSLYQFTKAIISIYPEIPDLKDQKKYFHGGKKDAIKIIENKFISFDNPILYAKSVDGLLFKNNIFEKSHEYKPFHPNKKAVLLERVINSKIENVKY